MQLSKGSILGSYRIEEFIASGGMGEVYKARHTQLESWVAIKVIREGIADDPGTLARFKREAKSASRLEHPNICRVYNFGQDGGRSFLVLEYLEGETLAVRIGREKLSIAEILQLGAEVAEALDHAHDHGLVHRDLKPSNIMLTKSGCKILDFGVAKRSHASKDSPFPEGGGTGSSTHEGVILGTLPYMAPEQVEGGGSDARTDIHALGAILYQVLTKRLPFEGRTPAALAVDILRGTPRPIEELEPTAPAALTRAVDKCLRKDPADRWQTARDLASELRWITHSTGDMAPYGMKAGRRHAGPRWGRVLPGAALAAAGLVVVYGLMTRGSGSFDEVLALSVEAPPGVTLPENHQEAVVSPNGEEILFVGEDQEGVRWLWSRSLSEASFERIDAARGGHTPFWHPTGDRIGYFAGTRLSILDLDGGGRSVRVATVSLESRGGSWGGGDVLLFSPGPRSGISKLSPGGTAEPLTMPNESIGEIGHLWPYFLPDGEHFLYLVDSAVDSVRGIYLASLGEPQGRRVVPSTTSAAYGDGHILFLRDGTLFAQQLDVPSGELRGRPVQLVDDVATTLGMQAAFSVSTNGVLAYSRAEVKDVTQLVWYEVDGRRIDAVNEPRNYRNPSLSDDGRYLAVEETDEGFRGITTLDLVSGASGRTSNLTPGAMDPVWGPGGRLAYVGEAGLSIYFWDMNSAAPPRSILSSQRGKIPTDWSPDGSTLLYIERSDRTDEDYDVFALDVATETTRRVLGRPHHELSPRLSPSGTLVAFASDEFERFEVFVEPFPSTGLRCQVSSAGGFEPYWGMDDQSLFYLEESGDLMIADLEIDPTRIGDACGAPQTRHLFTVDTGSPTASRNHYAFSRSTGRLLINVRVRSGQAIDVLFNWPTKARQAGL